MKVTLLGTDGNEKEVEIRSISINAKCSDLCFSELKAENGAVVAEHNGYVPRFLPGNGGNYVDLKIDLETGAILNWKKLTPSDIEKDDTEWTIINNNDEE
jgi:hypothetical protein